MGGLMGQWSERSSSPTAAVIGHWQRIQRRNNAAQSKTQRWAAVRVERLVRRESQCHPIRELTVTTAADSHIATTKQIAGISEPRRLRKDSGNRKKKMVNEMAAPIPIAMLSNGDWKYCGRMNMTTMVGISKRATLFCCLLFSRCQALPASRALTISMSRSSDVFIASPFFVFDTPTPNLALD
jgi:hypothetical protein